MKKLLFICIAILTFWSCSVDDDRSDYNYYFEFLPIEEVVIPEAFELDSTYQIEVSYYRPSNCHTFHDFYYVAEENERTVAVINIADDYSDCEELEDELIDVSFNFIAVYDQTYVFKFWQGENEAGEDIYLTYEIPIAE